MHGEARVPTSNVSRPTLQESLADTKVSEISSK